jgi:hypothetical protein
MKGISLWYYFSFVLEQPCDSVRIWLTIPYTLNLYKECSNITLNNDSYSLFFAPLGIVKMQPLRQLLFKAAIR